MMTALQTSSWGLQPTSSLDTLRKFALKTKFILFFFLVYKNIYNAVFFVFWLFRCQDAEAFELSSSGFTNGVFVKFLKKRLLDDEKITVVLDRVAEGETGTENTIYNNIHRERLI